MNGVFLGGALPTELRGFRHSRIRTDDLYRGVSVHYAKRFALTTESAQRERVTGGLGT
jgi:hypothetical protein